MIGQTLAHYQITAAIGAGGMGEVYRATDTRLGRQVALKVLPADMARDPERLERFQREARAVAAINHPHIVTIHSVEQAEGVHFLTMELVEGQPLDRVIPKGGLPVDRLLAIASAIADALAAAHGKGIVHRDLKPANVMVTAEGRVKVLDFGLAKFADEGARAEADVATALQTRDGVVMGTVPYMSPEQIAGRPVDHRTDIFSLGVILYEMAGGQRPFHGSSSAELASAILRDTPPSICQARADLPQTLGRVIERCLEKSAADRFATSSDLADRLRGVTIDAPAASSATRSESRPAVEADSGAARADEGFWVAVLPFKYRGTDAELADLAEGLSEEIVTGLSRFSYLRVIARSSTMRYANQTADVRAVGKELGARYVMEGALRQAGTVLRLAVQLVDASSGAHLWAETYNRPFRPEVIFELQDDLVPRIVSTVADTYGVLPHSISEMLRQKDLNQLSPYEAALRSFGYYERITPDEHAKVRDVLERAVDTAPEHADCWANLAMLYKDEHTHGFNVRPDPLGRALAAAHRAVEAAPANHLAYHALATALFFRRESVAFRNAAERTVALNAMDGGTIAFVGILMAYAGDWERGCALVERARQLNPNHPGWYWLPVFFNAYRKGDYNGALDAALRINMPGYFFASAALASVYGQLGEVDAARRAVEQLRALQPDFAAAARREYEKWFGPGELLEHVLDGLRKAGLDVPASGAPVDHDPPSSGTTTVAIAVLPFANMSADKDQDYFSDGLAEEIIHLLAQIPNLKVIARTSAFAFRGRNEDVRRIAQALDVTHVLEGSVRRAGDHIRVTAQLIAASDGAHVWSERYDGDLRDIFDMQDKISAAISRALRVKLSGEAQAPRYQPKLPAYEAYLQARHHTARVTPESMELSRKCLEAAIELDPDFALAHVGMAFYWVALTIFGGCPPSQAVPAARAANERALRCDPSLPEAHALLGFLAACFDYDWTAAERHFDAPLARQVGFSIVRSAYGAFQFFRGQVDDAIAITERTIAEDPLEVWPRMNLHAFLQAAGRDREAYDQALKALDFDGNQVVARVSIAHFHAYWEQLDQAVAAARRAVEVGPWYPDAVATLAATLRRSGEDARGRHVVQVAGVGRAFWRCASPGGVPPDLRRDRHGRRLGGEGDRRTRPLDAVLPALRHRPKAPFEPQVAEGRADVEHPRRHATTAAVSIGWSARLFLLGCWRDWHCV